MSQEEKVEMEDIIREEKSRRSRESGFSTDDTRASMEAAAELGSMKEVVRSKVEELSLFMEREAEELEQRMEEDMRDFLRRQEEEEQTLSRNHDLERSSLSARHRWGPCEPSDIA